MFDAIVHLARMSFTHGWFKPAEPARPLPERSTCERHTNDRPSEGPDAQAATPQRIWFGGCCGG